MDSLSEAYVSAQQRRVKKVAKILLGEYSKGERVKVARMPRNGTFWIDEWLGLEGTYLGAVAGMPGVSRVYFERPVCSPKSGWLVENTQLEHL